MFYVFMKTGRVVKAVFTASAILIGVSLSVAEPAPSMQLNSADSSKENIQIDEESRNISQGGAGSALKNINTVTIESTLKRYVPKEIRGIQLGIAWGAPISIINLQTGYQVSSKTLSGIQFGWISVPRINRQSLVKSFGLSFGLSMLSGVLEEETSITSSDFSMGQLSAALTYQVLEDGYVYVGIHLPSLTFGLQAVDLSFSGKTSPLFGFGYYFNRIWSLDLGISQNRYELEREMYGTKIGTLNIPTTKFSFNYTF